MFRLIILNNERVLYEGIVLSAILPGVEEEITILPFHGSLISRLRRGIITVHPVRDKAPKVSVSSLAESPNGVNRPAGGEELENITEETDRVVIKGGIARMEKNELVVLVE